jgi:hypothetical protein
MQVCSGQSWNKLEHKKKKIAGIAVAKKAKVT